MTMITGWVPCVLVGILVAGGTPSTAQEWIFGGGYADLSDDHATDSTQILLEYRHSPFHEFGRINVALAASAAVHSNGDVFVGGGLSARYAVNPRWFIEGSVMPGAYWETEAANDLGSTFEIRSLLAVGYSLKSGIRISFGISHKSNASTVERNPGVNSLLVRWHVSF